jgi:hypothetical protein
LSGARQRFGRAYDSFVRVKPNHYGAVVGLIGALKPVAFRPRLAHPLRHGKAGGEDFVFAETHLTGSGGHLRCNRSHAQTRAKAQHISAVHLVHGI